MQSSHKGIEKIFTKIRKDGWDINKPLKYGFFFFSKNKDNLVKIFNELKIYHYTKESIHEGNNGAWVLQVSKVEILKTKKLHRRNISFNDLAERYDSSYDGWDVGKSTR